MSFRYQEITPSPLLAPFINCFWLMEEASQLSVADRVLPDGCVEVLIHLRNRVERTLVNGQTTLNPQFELIGQQIRPYAIRLPGQNRVLGIRFFPHTFRFFSRIPLGYLTNEVLDASLAFGTYFPEVARRVVDAERVETAIHVLEAYFSHQVAGRRPSAQERLAGFAVRQLLQPGSANSLDGLTRQAGVSHRYLQQTFEEHVGIPPKLLQKILRFQRTFQHLADDKKSLTEVAYMSGYFDQSHFIRDFRRFAGVSPSAYRRELAPINQYCLAENSTSYLYNFR